MSAMTSAANTDKLATNGTHKKQKYGDDIKVQQFMNLYYGRLFPWQSLYLWLSYGHTAAHPSGNSAVVPSVMSSNFFQRREFCFTLEGDIFVRYQSFKDGSALMKGIRQQLPSKIDIGPVFNVDPQRRNAYSSGSGGVKTFMPVERELVFDIDLTDYDDVRTCCSGGNICGKCWKFMTVAIKVLDAGLRLDFGFNHILWVYSGRRGVHCWVCDDRARKLSNEARTSVAEYFSCYKGVEKGRSKVNVSFPLSPSLSRASDVLREYWESWVLPEMGLLDNGSEHVESMLAIVGDEDVVEAIRSSTRFRNGGGARKSSEVGAGVFEREDDETNEYSNCVSVVRWREIERIVQKEATKRRKPHLRKCLDEILFGYCYPRLDIEVSKHRNHLLKAPFCIHPKTGRVCVPIDPKTVDEFDPFKVPTISQLLNELEENMHSVNSIGMNGNKDDESVTKVEDWKKTSMADAVNTFERTFLNELTVACKDKVKETARIAREQKQPSTLAW